MAQAATFNDEIYQALRASGMDERHAMRAVMPDRDNFAARSDVAVLQTKVTTVEAAIIRIEKFIERIDETLAGMKEIIARLGKRIDIIDEKINSARALTRALIFAVLVPLHLLTLATLFGLLTKGILWAVAP